MSIQSLPQYFSSYIYPITPHFNTEASPGPRLASPWIWQPDSTKLVQPKPFISVIHTLNNLTLWPGTLGLNLGSNTYQLSDLGLPTCLTISVVRIRWNPVGKTLRIALTPGIKFQSPSFLPCSQWPPLDLLFIQWSNNCILVLFAPCFMALSYLPAERFLLHPLPCSVHIKIYLGD